MTIAIKTKTQRKKKTRQHRVTQPQTPVQGYIGQASIEQAKTSMCPVTRDKLLTPFHIAVHCSLLDYSQPYCRAFPVTVKYKIQWEITR